MRNQNHGLVVAIFFFSTHVQLFADGPGSKTVETPSQKTVESTSTDANALLMTIPATVQLRFNDSRQTKLKLLPRPILNWSNPIRQTPAGAVFLWTHHGRPAVAMCGYPNKGNVDYEFLSLSTRTLTAENLEREPTWRPAEPGVEIRDVAGIKPQKTRQRRSIQMRRIAGEFSADIVKRTSSGVATTPLRLLPTPVYRFPTDVKNSDDIAPDGEKKRGKLIDGALYGFVQSTDPEVLLMLEVWQDQDDKLSFTYSLGRMSMVYLQAKYQDKVIWKTEWAPSDPTKGYYTVHSTEQWPGDQHVAP